MGATLKLVLGMPSTGEGTGIVADDGTVVAKANEEGEEEMIFAQLDGLRRSAAS